MKEDYALIIENVNKSFPGVKALQDVSIKIRKGSVHAICGENGAGKSTLMKIINGIYQPDSGRIIVNGQETTIKNPLEARQHGIAMIAQETNFAPDLSIEENLFMGRLFGSSYNIDWKKLRVETQKLLDKEKMSLSASQKMESLTISEIQQIEILKALSIGASIIIMDEPTSSLTAKETDSLFKKIKSLRDDGKSVIYISHRMEEIFELADEVTIIRDGQTVDFGRIEDMDEERIIRKMVGRTITNIYPESNAKIGDEKIIVKNLTSDKFKDISFHAKSGEIIGFSGLVGAGRTELMQAIFCIDKYTNGEIYIDNKLVNISSVKDAMRNGIGMVTEDRKRTGILPKRNVRENATISSLEKFLNSPFWDRDKEISVTRNFFEKMDVKTPSMDTLIENLSGGNQQKVLLSKWLMIDPDILILDEPTKGIDVGNKFEIYKLMLDIVDSGKTIIMVSSDLPELMGMSDRIYIMSQGKITGELSKDEYDQELIMKYATI